MPQTDLGLDLAGGRPGFKSAFPHVTEVAEAASIISPEVVPSNWLHRPIGQPGRPPPPPA